MKVANNHLENSSDGMSQLNKDNTNQNQQKHKNIEGSLQSGEMTQFYYYKLMRIQYALSFAVMINLINIISAESMSYNDQNQSNKIMVLISLYFNIFCFVIECIILYLRTQTFLALEKQRKMTYEKINLFTSKYFAEMLFQYVIIFIQPYPFLYGVNYRTINTHTHEYFDYPFNSILTIIGVCRIYIVLRTLLFNTSYMGNRSNRLCKMYGCKADSLFAIKCLFKDNPLLLIIFFFLTSSLLFAYALFVAQRYSILQVQSNQICSTYQNALWLVIITITTVGYGDYFPQTNFGRIIILFVALWGTFIVSIMVVVVANTLSMEKNEKRTLLIIQRLNIREQLKVKAGKFIACYLSLKKYKDQDSSLKYLLLKNKLSYLKQQFSECKKKLKQMQDDQDLYDLVATHFLNLNNDIEILNENQDKIINFIHHYLQYNEQNKH